MVTVLYTCNEPSQLTVFVAVPQVAVMLISLYVQCTGLLQFGAFDQIVSVAVSPLLQAQSGGVIATPENENSFVGIEPQVRTGATVNVPLQLAVDQVVPQVAVAFIFLYVPDAGSLQFGAFVQVILVAVSPLLQIKVGGVIATSENPLAGTEPHVSLTGSTVNVPLQLTVKPFMEPQVTVAFISLYVPSTGSLQFGALSDQVISVAVSPLLQIKVGGVIAVPRVPLVGTEPQVTGVSSFKQRTENKLDLMLLFSLTYS
jgi:hypothetical protein